MATSARMGAIAEFCLTLTGLCAAGWVLRAFLQRAHVPAAVSLMALGALLGPSILDLLPESWLGARSTLSRAAFVVLLLRAGLGLPVGRLRAVLVPALLFGTLPVAVEILGLAGLGRLALFDRLDMAVLSGFLIAAVSPAVILPTMLDQKDLGRGAPRLVPDRIIVQTIVNAFVAQTGILFLVDVICPPEGWAGAGRALALLPLSVAGGLAVGVGAGVFTRLEAALPGSGTPTPGRVRVIAFVALAIALAVYFGCGRFELAAVHFGWGPFNLENVFAILALGVVLRRRLKVCERALRAELKRVWLVAEIVLFANLGSAIDLGKLSDPELVALLLAIVTAALTIRLVAAHLLSSATALTANESRYCTVAHVPKATIQAVFGAYPLSVFLERCGDQPALVDGGQTLVVMAVVAIVSTAPLGALLLDRLAVRYLTPEGREEPRAG
jgi:NhaP-type Na+/H+ or K+/H+ antiporter